MITFLPTHESRAEQVLKCLRGYVTRQTWVPEDRAIIAGILQEWHDEVETLELRIQALEAELTKSQAETDEWKHAAYSGRTP